jgi:hypothetical protein
MEAASDMLDSSVENDTLLSCAGDGDSAVIVITITFTSSDPGVKSHYEGEVLASNRLPHGKGKLTQSNTK